MVASSRFRRFRVLPVGWGRGIPKRGKRKLHGEVQHLYFLMNFARCSPMGRGGLICLKARRSCGSAKHMEWVPRSVFAVMGKHTQRPHGATGVFISDVLTKVPCLAWAAAQVVPQLSERKCFRQLLWWSFCWSVCWAAFFRRLGRASIS